MTISNRRRRPPGARSPWRRRPTAYPSPGPYSLTLSPMIATGRAAQRSFAVIHFSRSASVSGCCATTSEFSYSATCAQVVERVNLSSSSAENDLGLMMSVARSCASTLPVSQRLSASS